MKNLLYFISGGILFFNTLSFSQSKSFIGLFQYSQITAFQDTTKQHLVPVKMYFNQYESISTLGVLQKTSARDTGFVAPPSDESKRFSVYKNLSTNEMYSRERADTELLVIKDSLDTIAWNIIENQTRTIGKLKCQMATAKVRGRDYIAWFSPEIPFSFGPWKLHGLPGMILEAKSLDNQVEFRFESLQIPYVSSNPVHIKPLETSGRIRTVNQKEFWKQRSKNAENHLKMLQSRPDLLDSKITVKVYSIEVYPNIK